MLNSGKCCDEGKSFLAEVPDSPAAKAYSDIIDGTHNRLPSLPGLLPLLLPPLLASLLNFIFCCCVYETLYCCSFLAAILKRCETVTQSTIDTFSNSR